MPKHEQNESYGLPEDNFEGDEVCVGCRKRLGPDGTGPCGVYMPEGMAFRLQVGHCPVVNRYASWRDDKPITKATKKRIGQQKQR